MPSTRPQDLSSQSTFPTPSALWTNPGRYCQKLCIGDGRILVGGAGKELDIQLAETLRWNTEKTGAWILEKTHGGI